MNWDLTTVTILTMLVSAVWITPLLSALKETSDFKEATALMDVWKSATTTSGGQCVIYPGAILMLVSHAGNWDLTTLV